MLRPLDLAIAFDRKKFADSDYRVEIVRNGTVFQRVDLERIAEKPTVPFQAMIYDSVVVRLVRGEEFIGDDHFVYLMAYSVGQKPNGLRFDLPGKNDSFHLTGALIAESSLPSPALPTNKPRILVDVEPRR